MSDRAADLIESAGLARREARANDALRLFNEAVAAATAAGDHQDLIRALKGLAGVERSLGRRPDAMTHYEEAVAQCRAHGGPAVLAHTVRHLGDLHREARRTAEALACYEEAVAIYRSDGSSRALDVANALRGYALAREAHGDADAAAQLWREARGLYMAEHVEAGVAESEKRLAALGGSAERLPN